MSARRPCTPWPHRVFTVFARLALVLLLAALSGLATRPLWAQAVPSPSVSILGWTTDSELPSSARPMVPLVQLEPGTPGIVLFLSSASPNQSAGFRYRLIGYDPEWTSTFTPLVHYRHLRPGHYRFEVQSLAARSSPPTFLQMEQRPFFYQTWYFYLLVAAALTALGSQLLGQRDQLLKGQMGIILEERNRIASDCHDTLMAGFAAISWQLEATAKLFRDEGTGETPVAQSCELARSMVSHCQAEARRIIWDLRDSDELTDILSLALSRAIDEHHPRGTIATTFDLKGDEVPIAPGAVHHLVCIGQEAVANAIRHSGAASIHVALRYDADALYLSIHDDGSGFQVAEAAGRTGHFGIAVMHERARKLGGALRLTSTANIGTEVAVTVQFQSISQGASRSRQVVPWIGV